MADGYVGEYTVVERRRPRRGRRRAAGARPASKRPGQTLTGGNLLRSVRAQVRLRVARSLPGIIRARVMRRVDEMLETGGRRSLRRPLAG